MKQYSPEFKSQIIKEAQETGNVSMVARRHDLSPPTVYAWVRRSKKPSGELGNETRLEALEKSLRSSQLENEILKELLKKTNLAWLGDSASLEHLLRQERAK